MICVKGNTQVSRCYPKQINTHLHRQSTCSRAPSTILPAKVPIMEAATRLSLEKVKDCNQILIFPKQLKGEVCENIGQIWLVTLLPQVFASIHFPARVALFQSEPTRPMSKDVAQSPPALRVGAMDHLEASKVASS